MIDTFIERHGFVKHWGKTRKAPYPRIEPCEVIGCDLRREVIRAYKKLYESLVFPS